MFKFNLNNKVQYFKEESIPKSLVHVFAISRFCGAFPFVLVSKSGLLTCERRLLYIVVPLVVLIWDVVYFKDFLMERILNREIYGLINHTLTLANLAATIIVPICYKKRIQNAVEYYFNIEQNFTSNSSEYGVKVFAGIVFVSQNLVWLSSIFNKQGGGNLENFSHFEKFHQSCVEICLCFLMCYVSEMLYKIKGEIVEIAAKEEALLAEPFILDFCKIRKKPIQVGYSFETLRKTHFTIFQAVHNLNEAYGMANLILVIKQRFSLAFYLYMWIYNQDILNLALAILDLCKVGILFYSFQELKNQETALRCTFNELDVDFLDDRKQREFEYFRKQMHLLDIEFDACGLFSMDMNMIMPILISTVGYLLLLYQMNLDVKTV